MENNLIPEVIDITDNVLNNDELYHHNIPVVQNMPQIIIPDNPNNAVAVAQVDPVNNNVVAQVNPVVQLDYLIDRGRLYYNSVINPRVFTRLNSNGRPFNTMYPNDIQNAFSCLNIYKKTESISTSAVIIWNCDRECPHKLDQGIYHYFERALNKYIVNQTCPKCNSDTEQFCCNEAYLGGSTNPRCIEIMREWDYVINAKNNIIDIPRGMLKLASGLTVVWKCAQGHSFKARIPDRLREHPTNCAKCGTHAQVVDEAKSLGVKYPNLVAEWSDKNELSIFETPPSSNKKAWFICNKNSDCPRKCKHEYLMKINNKTNGKQGCPLCANKRACCIEKSFLKDNIHLYSEWDFERNVKDINGEVFIIDPTKITPDSSKLFHWICQNSSCGCVHYFVAPVIKRVRENRNCPYCSNQTPFVDYHKSVGFIAPHLITEWSPENNITPFQSACGSNINKNKWICAKNHNHKWSADNWHRVKHSTGCPHCKKDYSVGQCLWIQYLMKKNNIYIRYKLNHNDGEYKIPESNNKYSADGYDPKTNTIYEYHGCYWHGCKNCFDSSKKHPLYQQVTYGDLYNKTQNKKNFCISKGYKYVEMWECEFNKLKSQENITPTIQSEFAIKNTHFDNCKCNHCVDYKQKNKNCASTNINNTNVNTTDNTDIITDDNTEDNIDITDDITDDLIPVDNIPEDIVTISSGKEEIDTNINVTEVNCDITKKNINVRPLINGSNDNITVKKSQNPSYYYVLPENKHLIEYLPKIKLGKYKCSSCDIEYNKLNAFHEHIKKHM